MREKNHQKGSKSAIITPFIGVQRIEFLFEFLERLMMKQNFNRSSRSLLFVIDPADQLNVKKDSSIALMRAASAMGMDIFIATVADLSVNVRGKVGAWVQAIRILPLDVHQQSKNLDQATQNQSRVSSATWFAPVVKTSDIDREKSIDFQHHWCQLTDFSAVMMRKDPPFDMKFVAALWLLRRAKEQGARVVNDPDALLLRNEKLAILAYPDLISPTLVSSSLTEIRHFHQQHRDVILKPLDGMGGAGVFRITDNSINLSCVVEILTQQEQTPLMAQRYIPAVSAGDRRVLVVHGQVMPYVLARMPQANETRANLAAGGVGVAQPISPRERLIAESVAPDLMCSGVVLAGLDVIGDYLTEINITSPTCMVEIAQQTGFDISRQVIEGLLDSDFTLNRN